MKYAPVILFAYNRPEFVRQALQSLSENLLANETELFIFADGPKMGATIEESEKISKVRQLLREKKWCGSVKIFESEFNKGLARSVIDGVTEIIHKYGKVIVVEDDVVLSPYFLSFMNDALDAYRDDERVLSIGSWSYFASPEKIVDETYFFRFPDSIAWATFDRAWKLFEEDSVKILRELKAKNKIRDFNAGLNYPYFSNMLQAQIDGVVNSWAIRWTAIAVLNEKLSLFPSISLSKHIGFAADATHEKNSKDYNKDILLSDHRLSLIKKTVEESPIALEEWKNFYLRNFIPANNWKSFVRGTFKKIISKSILDAYRKIRYKGK